MAPTDLPDAYPITPRPAGARQLGRSGRTVVSLVAQVFQHFFALRRDLVPILLSQNSGRRGDDEATPFVSETMEAL